MGHISEMCNFPSKSMVTFSDYRLELTVEDFALVSYYTLVVSMVNFSVSADAYVAQLVVDGSQGFPAAIGLVCIVDMVYPVQKNVLYIQVVTCNQH